MCILKLLNTFISLSVVHSKTFLHLLNGKYSKEQDGFTSLKDTTANHSNKEHGGMNPEPRIPPPNQKPVSVAAFKRTSPNGRKNLHQSF